MYSAQLLDHFQNPRNSGDLANADATAEIENPVCGDVIRLSLNVRNDSVQDIRFKAMAQDWQREGRAFGGLVFGHQLHGTIGQYVQDLELIAQASEPGEWVNAVEHLPF